MDLREYIEVLDRKGYLLKIDQEVDWNLEAACIGGMMQRVGNGRYAILFNNVKDYYPDRGRIATNLFTGPQKRVYTRFALALGLPEDMPYPEFKQELMRRFRNQIKPVEIAAADARCKEVIKIGKDANLLDLPIPMVHGMDGGRYSTLHSVINQDPDTGWTNVALYRMMVKGPRRWAHLWVPGGHGASIHMMKWEMRGQTMPICIAIGGDPLLLTAAAASAPTGLCEYDIVGGLRGEPLEVVRAETNNLLVPAGAEIIIEGEVRPGERTDEGPFGEMAGFTHGRNVSPVFRVNAITHRKNPVVPMTVEGIKMQDDTGITQWSFASSAELYMNSQGFPVPEIGAAPPITVKWAINCDPETPSELHKIAQTWFGHKNMIWSHWLAMTDPGVSLQDWTEVYEAVGLNCDPRDLKKCTSDLDAFCHPLMFYTDVVNRFRGTDGAKFYYDATTKFKDPRFILRKDNFEKAFPEEIRQRVREKWEKLGFDESWEDRQIIGGD